MNIPQTSAPKPTNAELTILRVLWQRGPSTVRQVRAELERVEPTGYTTVLKLLQIMTEKSLVVRDESQRAHVYCAAITEEGTQRGLVRDLLDRAFDGSAGKLVLQALDSRPADPDELRQIRQMLDRLEEDEDRGGRA